MSDRSREFQRRQWSIGLVALVWGLAACTGPTDLGREHLADAVPVVDQGVSTDIILPAYQDSLDLLGRGWEDAPGAQATEAGRWVVGQTGDFRFYSATDGPLTLEVEATALTTPEAPQHLEILLNNRSVDRKPMAGPWSRYAFGLPASDVQLGWNEVTLRFDHALRPSDVEPNSQDARQLAARFRRLRVRSAEGRAIWPDRPMGVEVVPPVGETAPIISMPTDAVVTFHLVPKTDTIIRGAVSTRPTSQVATGITGVMEVVEASGQTHRLIEHHAGDSDRQPFGIDLLPWADEPIQLQLRAWGRDNGLVQWEDVTLSTPADPTVGEVTHPARLVIPPVSGRLGSPDVLLILLDAARADAFNDDLVETPAVDALASEGTRFRDAISPTSWTGQSVPAMLTGLYPGATGAQVWSSPIPEDLPTLAERLSEAGYQTSAWSQHSLYSNNKTLLRGVAHFVESRGTVLERAVLPTADDLFVDGQPTFTLIHLLPPHGPYRPPEPFNGSLSGWYTGDFPQSAPSLARAAQPQGRKPTDEDVRYIRARYDENVRFADHLVGELVQMFRDAGRYDDAIVIVTSDHGEGFFEHGRFIHTRLLYEEFIRIPLIIKWPQAVHGFSAEVDDTVSLVDLAPTLVDGLGLATRTGFQGRTLLPLAFDGASPHRDLFVQTRGAERLDATPSRVKAMRTNGYKVILGESVGSLEVYHLTSDPNEHHDLAETDPMRARALLQRLLLQTHRNALVLSDHTQEPAQPLDEEALQRLRALGYLR